MPVFQLKETIDADEFDGWCRFMRHYPFDPESMYLVPAALVASTIVNAHGGGRDGRPVTIRDLLPERAPPKPEDPKALDEKFRSFFRRQPHNDSSEEPA